MNCLCFNANTFGIPMSAQLPVTYSLWEGPEDDWITVETCSPIVISKNKCCADVKTDLFDTLPTNMLTESGILEYNSACKRLPCEQNWMLFRWVVTQFRSTADALQLNDVTACYVVCQITKHNAVNLRNEKQLHPDKEHSFVTW